MSGTSLAGRYWRTLIGAPQRDDGVVGERGHAGYPLGQRYWAGMFNLRLPVRRETRPEGETWGPVRPWIDGSTIRLPRFDPTAIRYAATELADRASVRWTVGELSIVIRDAGPGELEILIDTARPTPETAVLPVEMTSPAGTSRLLVALTPERAGRAAGALRVPRYPGWMELAVREPLPAGALAGTDPAVREEVAASVRATPDPAMPAWRTVRDALPPDHPLRQVITDAAG